MTIEVNSTNWKEFVSECGGILRYLRVKRPDFDVVQTLLYYLRRRWYKKAQALADRYPGWSVEAWRNYSTKNRDLVCQAESKNFTLRFYWWHDGEYQMIVERKEKGDADA